MLFTCSLRLLSFTRDMPLLTGDSSVVTWAPDRPDERVVLLPEAVARAVCPARAACGGRTPSVYQ